MNLSRRELMLRGALGGAALALPAPEALAGVRKRKRRKSVHCLKPADRFTPAGILPDCSFAIFSPDSLRVALTTPRGIEIYNRTDQSRTTVTPPGFTVAPGAWSPDGSVLLVSGPAGDGSGPFLWALGPQGRVRLLPNHPGQARAATFSPDGRKVAFTYVNRFVHILAMADWTGTGLASPVNLMPVDPAGDGSVHRIMATLAWHETRGFSPDGQRLYFASDRGAGMLNVSVQYLDLAKGTRHRVTYDEGVSEGAVLGTDNQTLYTATTRAREPAFMTMFSGPAVPPFLGFVAKPTLHEHLAGQRLAVIGNGDVIAVDSTYGLRGRMVGNRKKLADRLNQPVEGGAYRLVACSMSPDGEDLAVAMGSALGSSVVLLRRDSTAVPQPAQARPTPSPPGTTPLGTAQFGAVRRTVGSPRGGSVTLNLEGTLAQGRFRVGFNNFSADGVHVFGGTAEFRTGGGGFSHSADVRRINVDSEEEVKVFYGAQMQANWAEAAGGVRSSGGRIASLSRSGRVSAAWDGRTFAPQNGWKAGNRGPRPVAGARRCKRVRGR